MMVSWKTEQTFPFHINIQAFSFAESAFSVPFRTEHYNIERMNTEMNPAEYEPDIATPDEVLETFTQLMRSEKTSEQLKAAEQLAKYHSLFTPKESAGYKPELIAEIEAAVLELTRQQEADDAPSDSH